MIQEGEASDSPQTGAYGVWPVCGSDPVSSSGLQPTPAEQLRGGKTSLLSDSGTFLDDLDRVAMWASPSGELEATSPELVTPN